MASSTIHYECESTLDLGFPEDVPGWILASRFFRSKVGGRPSWLNLADIPKNEELHCQSCGKMRIFLLQVYAPIDTDPDCFHRTIFIFMCPNPACHQGSSAQGFLVLRSQLSRKNDFFPYEPPVEMKDWKSELNVGKFVQVCRACGLRGSAKCSGCGKVNYCSREHQTADWKFRHKNECKNDDFVYAYCENEELVPNLLLPQKEIVMTGDDEEISDSDDDDFKEVNIDAEIAKIKDLEQNGETLSGADLAEFATEDQVVKDKNFKRFQKVVRAAPQQIMRYQKASEPLLVSTENTPESVEECGYCGSKRVFEFQIMPQILTILKLDKLADEESIDWGTLLVYTCEKSCSTKDMAYKKEFLWKQNFS